MNRRDAIKAAASICCLPLAIPAAAGMVTESVSFEDFDVYMAREFGRQVEDYIQSIKLRHYEVIAGPLRLRPKKLRFPVDLPGWPG